MSSTTAIESPTSAAPLHPLKDFWRYFSASRGAVLGLFIVITVLLLAAFAPVIAPYNPDLTDTTVSLVPPAWQAGHFGGHWYGVRPLGRLLPRCV